MTRNPSFLVVTLLPFLMAADTPSPQPATAPTVDDSTPLAFLHSSGAILPAGGYPAEALGLFTTRDTQERRVADVLANYSLAVAKTEVAVRDKWGATADDSFVHAARRKDRRRHRSGGDRRPRRSCGWSSSRVVKPRRHYWFVSTAIGRWIPARRSKQTQKQGTVDSWLKYSNDVIALLKRVDENLAAGKYSSATDLCRETTAGVTRASSTRRLLA